MTPHQIKLLILDPKRNTDLGAVGIALVAAAKK